MTVLLVDVANTVGARPDGWWRDRAGATARLPDRLVLLPGRTLPGPEGTRLAVTALVAVVEGRARDVAAPAGLRLVRAPGSGDDALAEVAAELAAADLLVVTADRELRTRLPATARTVGPGWLLAAADGVAADRADGAGEEQDRRP